MLRAGRSANVDSTLLWLVGAVIGSTMIPLRSLATGRVRWIDCLGVQRRLRSALPLIIHLLCFSLSLTTQKCRKSYKMTHYADRNHLRLITDHDSDLVKGRRGRGVGRLSDIQLD